jgi:UDPglucose 6-dehydrogenase
VRLQVYDPVAMPAARQWLGERQGLSFASSGYEALKGAEALLVITEWTQFREPDLERMKSLMQAPVVFDGRNLYKPEKMAKYGFTYFPMGRLVKA